MDTILRLNEMAQTCIVNNDNVGAGNYLMAQHKLINNKTLLDNMVLCNSCGLRGGCSQHVPGVGPLDADLMIVGEGPGAKEDEQGKPFVGPAGEVLNDIFKAIGWNRSDIYITNIIKCRPPGNRTPRPDEVAKCSQYLVKEIAMVQPKVILCLGSPAANAVIHPDFKITREQGTWFELPNHIMSMALFHPAYVLHMQTADPTRVYDIKLAMWDGIQAIDHRLKQLKAGVTV